MRDVQRHLRAVAAMLVMAAASVACAPLHRPTSPVPPASAPPEEVAPVATAPRAPPVPAVVYIPKVEPEDAAARHLLALHARLQRLGPAELAAELAQLADPGSSPQAAMDRALILGHTRAPGDLMRAIALLDGVLADDSLPARPWHALAALLAARFNEQRRAEEQVDRLTQQLRDSQRDHQRRLDQLSEKLEALRAIERSLTNRPVPAPLPAPAAPAPARPGA